MTIEEILKMNNVDKNASLPPGFPPAPPEMGDFKGKNEQEYKEYMRLKLQREQWENSLTLYKMREREGDRVGMQNVINRAKTMFDVAAMPTAQELPPDSKEASAIDSIMEQEGIEVEEKSEPEPEPAEEEVRDNLKHLKQNKKEQVASVPKKEKAAPKPEPFIPRPENGTTTAAVGGPDGDDSFLTKLGPPCSSERRHIFFIPSQVLFLIVAIVGTATGLIGVGIVFGIILAAVCLAISVLIMLPYRLTARRLPMLAFFIGDIAAMVLCVVGAIINQQVAVFYCGIPALVAIIIATVAGQFFVIRNTFVPGEGISS